MVENLEGNVEEPSVASGIGISRVDLILAMLESPNSIPGKPRRRQKGQRQAFYKQSLNLAKALDTERLGNLLKVMKLARWGGRGWDLNSGSVAPGFMLLTAMVHSK